MPSIASLARIVAFAPSLLLHLQTAVAAPSTPQIVKSFDKRSLQQQDACPPCPAPTTCDTGKTVYVILNSDAKVICNVDEAQIRDQCHQSGACSGEGSDNGGSSDSSYEDFKKHAFKCIKQGTWTPGTDLKIPVPSPPQIPSPPPQTQPPQDQQPLPYSEEKLTTEELTLDAKPSPENLTKENDSVHANELDRLDNSGHKNEVDRDETVENNQDKSQMEKSQSNTENLQPKNVTPPPTQPEQPGKKPSGSEGSAEQHESDLGVQESGPSKAQDETMHSSNTLISADTNVKVSLDQQSIVPAPLPQQEESKKSIEKIESGESESHQALSGCQSGDNSTTCMGSNKTEGCKNTGDESCNQNRPCPPGPKIDNEKETKVEIPQDGRICHGSSCPPAISNDNEEDKKIDMTPGGTPDQVMPCPPSGNTNKDHEEKMELPQKDNGCQGASCPPSGNINHDGEMKIETPQKDNGCEGVSCPPGMNIPTQIEKDTNNDTAKDNNGAPCPPNMNTDNSEGGNKIDINKGGNSDQGQPCPLGLGASPEMKPGMNSGASSAATEQGIMGGSLGTNEQEGMSSSIGDSTSGINGGSQSGSLGLQGSTTGSIGSSESGALGSQGSMGGPMGGNMNGIPAAPC